MRKVLHWFACHLVLLVFLGFLLIAVIFRGPLFGITGPVETELVEEVVEVIPNTPESQSQVISLEKPLKPDSGQSEPDQPQEMVSSSTKVDSEMIEEAASPLVETQPAETQPAETPAEEREPVLEVASVESDFAFRPENDKPVTNDDLKSDLLQQARRAYWNDQLNKARSLYQAYIDLDPENPDGYGELGNLLGTAGELDEAAKMYGKAAELLTQQDRLEEAEQLIQVLESINVIKRAEN